MQPTVEVAQMRFNPTLFGGIKLDAEEFQVSEEEILADLLYPAHADAPARPSGRPERGRPQAPARSRASSTRRRTPKPVGPLPTYSRPTSQAVPAMSRWTHGLSSTNSSRNSAA